MAKWLALLLRVRAAESGPSRPWWRVVGLVVIGVIVLQNSFLGYVQIFSGALECSLENYVGGHMNSPISNRLPL
jgi:hypothetical protein